MKLYAIALCALYLAVKLLVRSWVFRPATERPVGLRSRETLQMLDLFAALFLIAAVFMFINAGKAILGVWIGAALLGYDFALRSVFLHVEIKRLREKSKRRSYRSAHKQVHQRTLSDMTY